MHKGTSKSRDSTRDDFLVGPVISSVFFSFLVIVMFVYAFFYLAKLDIKIHLNLD